jgi:hemoglobin
VQELEQRKESGVTESAEPKIAVVTETGIERLVDCFYRKVRTDPELGPVFDRAIQDWPSHLAIMRNFWSSVMLTSGRYKGNPVAVHAKVQGLERHLFARWLELFDQTCTGLFVPSVAEAFRQKARRIAESLQLALFYRPDRAWDPDPRSTSSRKLHRLPNA